jgi:hypothetical protein
MKVTTSPEVDGSAIYWARVHVTQFVISFFVRHKVWAIAIAVALVSCAVLFRETWQPSAVLVRRYATPILLSVAIMCFFWFISKKASLVKRTVSMVTACVLVGMCVVGYEYLALSVRYQSFKVEVIDTIPETDNERIQPLASVHALAQGVMGDSRNPGPPDFVWVKNKKTGDVEYRWVMGVEPKLWIDKIFGSVEEVINVSATDPSPSLNPESRTSVRFAVGENLWLSSNANTAAIRTFDLGMFFNYEPTDVRYLENEKGEMIEVISLLRWRGLIFPYPEFGGVLIVKQSKQDESVVESYVKRILVGEGRWVSPERIQEFSYLKGQNIVPYRVSRYIAESLRFMNGFMAPFPGWHQGDVRIPDTKENLNKQPYATFFKETNGMPGMLYHYFSLEPYLAGNNGLVASVLIPADGTSRVLVYQHEARNESLIGVSMVPGLVRDSKKTYNWDKSAPVEERPYVRYINGKRRMLWLTTVITYKDSKKESFVTGSIPEVALVDTGGTHEVIWVDPSNQKGWIKALSP